MAAEEASRLADGRGVPRFGDEADFLAQLGDFRSDVRFGVLQVSVENVAEHAREGEALRVLFNDEA